MDGGEQGSGSSGGSGGSAATLLEALVAQQQVVAAAQAQLASLVVGFADRRVADDEPEIEASAAGGGQAGQARPGEFVADEVSCALRLSVWESQRWLARCRWVRVHLPSVWQAALAGQLDEPRLVHLYRAARLIEEPHTVAVLDEQVVEVATARTVKQLDSWLSGSWRSGSPTRTRIGIT